MLSDLYRQSHVKLTDRLGVFVCLSLGGRSGVLAVICELVRESVSSNGIGVDHGGTSTSDHRPDTALCVEDGQLERCTGRAIEFLDVSLFLGQITTEGSWPDLQCKP